MFLRLFMLTLLYLFGLYFEPSVGDLSLRDKNNPEKLFEGVAKAHGKQYASNAEKIARSKTFVNNLKEIENLNVIDAASYGINQFTDLSKKEFLHKHTGHRKMPFGQQCEVLYDDDINTRDAPDELNWKSSGIVTEVKNQNDCSAGWAFATVGNIESQYAKKYGKKLNLSVQELIDCVDECAGCSGGSSSEALSALIDIGGLETESSYPYVAKKHNSCNYKPVKTKVKVTGCTSYDLEDEDNLKEVLAKTGPLYVAVNGAALKHYTQGIQDCSQLYPTDVDHAVLLVGYGTEGETDFWLIKNSWGTMWGEKGYARIRRGVNACGLMNPATATATIN